MPFVAAMAASRMCRWRKKDVNGPSLGAGFQKWVREGCWRGRGADFWVAGAGGCG